jgi:hypothetical protein
MGADIRRHEHKIFDGYQYYYQVMRKTIVQFLDLFNDIKIGRYDTETGQLLSFVKVPLKFAPKSKNWYWVEKIDSNGQRIRDKILPIIGVYLVDAEIDNGRFVNKLHSSTTGFHERVGDKRYIKERFVNPIPFNFVFQVQILAEYMIDIIQITEQIFPYFTPNLNIKIDIPELDIDGKTVEKLDLKVLYNGSSKDDPITMGPDELRYLKWNLDFTVEGYLFQPKFDYPVIREAYTEFIIGSLQEPENICDTPFTPSGGCVTLTNTGLSAEKFPLNVTNESLSGSLYDEDLKLLYDYERDDDL